LQNKTSTAISLRILFCKRSMEQENQRIKTKRIVIIKKNLAKKVIKKMHKNVIYPKVKFQDVLSAFWRGARPQRLRLFFLLTSIILANITIILIPILYKHFFDVIVAGGDRIIIARNLLTIIINVAVLNGIFWILYRIASFSNNIYQPIAMANLKQQSYDYLMEHSYYFFAGNFIGSLVQKVNRFARSFERISDNLTWNLLPLLVKIVSIFIVILFINKLIALVFLIWIIIFLSFNIIFSKWKLKYDVMAASMDSEATGYLADTITNQNTISLFSGLFYEKEGYKNITNKQAKTIRFTWNLEAAVEGGQAFLGFAIQFILFFIAIRYWGQGLITVGVFFLIEIYLITIIDQLWGFTRLVRDFYQNYADAKEMVEIMLLSHEIKDAPLAKELLVSKGEIIFENLSFSFNKTRKILENINLIIRPGEKVALVGPSGAGKTTLVRLLLRLYSLESGKILIDGQDISKVTQHSLRKNISIVPQDTILFHRTISENIEYGKLGAGIKEIKKSAELSHSDEFIKSLPDGFQTYVGERGIKLSGGERQRVAIARAILKNAPILILDEATSSLDSHSEMLIQDALNTLMMNRTTIVIAHRLSTIQKMDRIIVIDQGKIIEEGSHNDLLNKSDSLYRKLWTLQAGGFLASDEEEIKINENESVIKENNDDEEKEEVKFINF